MNKTKICTICKQELTISSFYTNGKTSSGKTKYKGPCKTCENKRNKDRYISIIRDFYSELSCQLCGYNRCIEALEFHHTDPTQKEFTISNKRTASKDKLLNEMKKCMLLCANCHREQHFGVISSSGRAPACEAEG